MANPLAPSTTKYGLYFVESIIVNGVKQDPAAGALLLDLFVLEIGTDKAVAAANTIQAISAQLPDNTKYSVVVGKNNGLREQLDVTGADLKAIAKEQLAVVAARKSRKVLQEGTKGQKVVKTKTDYASMLIPTAAPLPAPKK